LHGAKRLAKHFCIGALLIALGGTLMINACALPRRGAQADFFQRPSWLAQKLAALSPKDSPSNWRLLALYETNFGPKPGTAVQGDATDLAFFSYQFSRQILNPNSHIDEQINSAFGYEGAPVLDYLILAHDAIIHSHAVASGYESDEKLARFAQLTAVKYITTRRLIQGGGGQTFTPLDSRYFELLEDNQDMSVRLYAVRDTLPRACFVTNWRTAGSHEAALAVVSAPQKSGFNPAILTIIEGAAEPSSTGGTSSPGLVAIPVAQPSPGEVDLNVDAPRLGYVVLCDQFYPGWHATVDGAPVEIKRANGVCRAVAVGPGQHQVRFTYDPDYMPIALAIAALAFVASLGLGITAHLQRSARRGNFE
jgi:hypothetical protein